MNTIEWQKKLLIAESELNRMHVTAEKAALHSGLHAITHGAGTVGDIATSAVLLASNLAAIPRKQDIAGTKPSRLQTVLYGVVLVSSIWLALIPRKQ